MVVGMLLVGNVVAGEPTQDGGGDASTIGCVVLCGVLPSGHNLLAGSKCIARARDGGREAITASAAAIALFDRQLVQRSA